MVPKVGKMRTHRFRAALSVTVALVTLTTVSPAATGSTVPEPRSFSGDGFDACSAPSSARMDAWLASPYRSVGVYVGGINRACTQPELTAGWAAHQEANGWHLLPIYLGLQAPCTTSKKKYLIDPAHAVSQGRAEANTAVAAAKGLGLPPSSTLFFDMEAYQVGNTRCTSAVLGFLGAWTSRLHDWGYFSGVYASIASGVTDMANDYRSAFRPHADYLFFARYDGNATTDNAGIRASYWAPHRRAHQYRGGRNETYGGVTINIDNDYVDLRPLPRARFGDFTENGWSDLLGRQKSTGSLYLYPGNGTNLERPRSLGTGWNRYSSITRLGDFNRDGHEDLVARSSLTGDLWLYPGTGSGLGRRIQLGRGWNAMREITAVGDLDGDRYPDLLAVRRSTGCLYFYPGRGTSVGTGNSLGCGWNAMSELTGVGDLTGDGRRDLLARQTATGTLYLYPGRSRGFAPRIRLSTGWTGRRHLAGVGDFNRDGHPDLMAVDSSTGGLYLYPGKTGGLSSRIRLSTGWSDIRPLL
jgi:hypothetical protein